MPGIDRQRREHRIDLLLEIFVEPLQFARGQLFLERHEPHPALGQLGEKLVVNELLLLSE